MSAEKTWTTAARVRVLGPICLNGPAGIEPVGREQDRRVLARLCLRQGEAASIDDLIESVWVDHLPSSPKRSLQNAILRIRKQLSAAKLDGLIETVTAGYRLTLESSVDLWEFRQLVDNAGIAGMDPGSDDSGRLLQAVEMAALEPFADLGPHPFWVDQRAAFDHELTRAAEELLLVAIGTEQLDNVLLAVDPVGARSPDNERLAGLRMAGWALVGQMDRSVEIFDQLRNRLGDRGLVPPQPVAAVHAALTESRDVPQGRELLRLLEGNEAQQPTSAPVTRPTTKFVGRTVELGCLRSAWGQSAQGQVVVDVSGESGVGKSALARVFAQELREDEVLVLWGEARRGPASPLGVIAEALRPVFTERHAPLLRANLVMFGAELTRLIGAASWPIDVPVAPPLLGTEDDLSAAVVSLVQGLVTQGRVLVVVDDVQWMRPDDLELLRRIVDHSVSSDLMVLLLRRTDSTTDTALGATHRIALEPLPTTDARKMIVGVSDQVSEGELDQLLELAEGSPLVLSQLAVALARGGETGDGGPAGSLSDLVGDRLDSVGPEAVHIARAAAVAVSCASGPFRRALGDIDSEVVEHTLGGLENAGILHHRDNNIEFVHDLIRGVLDDGLGPVERAYWHDRLARTLSEVAEPDLVAVARHRMCAAAEQVGVDTLLVWVHRAATLLYERRAFLECGQLIHDAARLISSEAMGSEAGLKLMVVRGEALASGGLDAESRSVLWGIFERCATAGHTVLAARIALALSAESRESTASDQERVRSALEAVAFDLRPSDHELRSRAYFRLAFIEASGGSTRRRRDLERRGLGEAQRARDPAVVGRALGDWLHLQDPAVDLDSYEARGSEILEVGRFLDDRSLIVSGLQHYGAALLLRGRDFPRFVHVVRRLRDTYQEPRAEASLSLLSLLRGDLVAARRQALDVLTRRAVGLSGDVVAGVEGQLLAIRRMNGEGISTEDRARLGFVNRLWEVAPLPGPATEQDVSVLSAMVGEVASLKRIDRASSLAAVARLAAAVADAEQPDLAETLLSYLADRKGLFAASGIVDFAGAVDHYRGRLSVTVGDLDAAQKLLSSSMIDHRRTRAVPWLVESQLALADLELVRSSGNRDIVKAALEGAADISESLGLVSLLGRVEAMRSRLDPVSAQRSSSQG